MLRPAPKTEKKDNGFSKINPAARWGVIKFYKRAKRRRENFSIKKMKREILKDAAPRNDFLKRTRSSGGISILSAHFISTN